MNATTQRAKSIFMAMVAKMDPDKWSSHLDTECGDDHELRRRVEALLEAHTAADSFLAQPAANAVATMDMPPTQKSYVGTSIGRYKLREQIGEGGFGVVYVAEQTKPVRRKVALKVIKPGMDTKEVISRFEAERQALALMDHPNIAKVLDAGATESGRPYFVMELVRGIPITDYCDQQKLDTKQRLQLFAQVCRAVQHAHQKGVIHRDIKPSNVLVADHDGTPVPKVIDFGVAKAINQRLTEQTIYTRFHEMIGTPMYMSPEQAEFSGLDVDTRTDVYSLGVLLYQLLTGVPPFDKETFKHASYDEIRRIIREDEPRRPSLRISTLANEAASTRSQHRSADPRKLSREVGGELDWLVMKSLEKERNRRYESASAFATDVERYLNNEAVEACPPSTIYRLKKFVRRNKVAFATVATVALALILGVAGTVAEGVRATRAERSADAQLKVAEAQRELAKRQGIYALQQKRLAEERADEVETQNRIARRNLYFAHTKLADVAWNEGHVLHARNLLRRYVPDSGQEDLRSFEWYYLWDKFHQEQLTFYRESSFVRIRVSPDGQRLMAACDDALIWDAISGELLAELDHSAPVAAIAVSHDGKLIVTGDDDGKLRFWDADTWEQQPALEQTLNCVRCIAFSPDDRILATSSSPAFNSPGPVDVRLWDLESRRFRKLGEFDRIVFRLAFSPDGETLATSGEKGLKLWNVTTLEELSFNDGGMVHCMAFSSNGDFLATTGPSEAVLWDRQSERKLASFPKCGNFALALSADDRMMATAGSDAQIRVFDTQSKRLIHTLYGHTNWVWSLAFSPDGKTLASAGRDGTVRLWRLEVESSEKTIAGKSSIWAALVGRGSARCTPLAMSEDRLAVVGPEGSIKLFSMPAREEVGFLKGHPAGINAVAFSRDAKLLASASGDINRPGQISLCNLANGNQNVALDAGPGIFSSVALSPDGKMLAAGEGSTVPVWDVASGRLQMTLGEHFSDVTSVAFSPDGKTLAAATLEKREHSTGKEVITGGEVKLWDVGTSRARSTRRWAWGLAYRDLAFSPDGTVLAVAGENNLEGLRGGLTAVIDAATGDDLAIVEGQRGAVLSLAFSPDNKILATGGSNGTIKLFDRVNWEERLTLDWEGRQIYRLTFSSDGNTLAAGSDRGQIRLWHVDKAGVNDLLFQEMKAERRHRAGILAGEANFLANQGQWEKAIECYSQSVQLAPNNVVSSYREALLLLGADEKDSYRAACRAMLLRFQKSVNIFDKYWTVWTCLLAAEAVDDYTPLVRVAEQSLEADPSEAIYLMTLGAVLYRAGRVEEALERLTAAVESEDPVNTSNQSPAYIWYFLAMVHHSLGHPLEAQQWLDEANDRTDTVLREDAEGTSSLAWNRKLTLKLFRSEAETLLGSSATEPNK